MSVIYDFGANRGMNIPYYLLKAETVVAVEANASLAEGLRKRFAREVASRRLRVVDCAVTTAARASTGRAPFFAYNGEHENGHQWSSLVPPEVGREDYVETDVPLTHPATLFETYGWPSYVKIDVEHHDFLVLQDILAMERSLPYLSVEAHDPRVLGLLLLEERFTGFKLFLGQQAKNALSDVRISTVEGPRRWSFPPHSAGPFGEDMPGPWLDRSALVQHYGNFGPGWIDIHATTRHGGTAVPLPTESLSTGVRGLTSLAARAASRALWSGATSVVRHPGSGHRP